MDKKRERGDNWSQEEKDLFLQIMSQSAAIIENKKTDTNTNKQKTLEWINVQRKFYELSGKKREVLQLKGAWRRLRIGAKKRIGEHKRAINATGGGQKPSSPTDEDKKIMEICPTDFIIENNDFDSDGIFNKKLDNEKQEKETEEICNDENIIEQFDESGLEVVHEIVIAEIHENEVTINSSPCHSRSSDTIMQELKPNQIFLDNKENLKKRLKQRDTKQKVEGTKRKFESSQKANIVQSNNDVKDKTMAFLKEEYDLRIKYQKQELCQQELRHKLEIELLMKKKEKQALKIQLLNEKVNK